MSNRPKVKPIKSEALVQFATEMFVEGFMAGWNRRHNMSDAEAEEFLSKPNMEAIQEELNQVNDQSSPGMRKIMERYGKVLLN